MRDIAREDGDIQVFAGGATRVFAYESDLPKGNIIRKPAVLIQSRGKVDVVYCEVPFTFKNEMWAYSCEDKNQVKYLYYYLKAHLAHFRDIAERMGAFPQIAIPDTENFPIPLPPLSEQARIVSILDRFEALVHGLQEGLPGELQVRRAQYDYWRDRLVGGVEL